MLGEAQTKLATATTKEANAGEQARQTAAHSSQLRNDMIYKSMSKYDAEFPSAQITTPSNASNGNGTGGNCSIQLCCCQLQEAQFEFAGHHQQVRGGHSQHERG